MAGRADAVLKLSLALAALMAGGGVGFYYGIYLPSQDVRRQGEAMVARETEAAEATRALAERAKREKAAQVAYEDCMSTAELSFKNYWTASCRTQHQADVVAYEDCADDLFATEAGCAKKHPVRPERGCALPGSLADRLTESRRSDEQQCLGQLQAAQAAGNGR